MVIILLLNGMILQVGNPPIANYESDRIIAIIAYSLKVAWGVFPVRCVVSQPFEPSEARPKNGVPSHLLKIRLNQLQTKRKNNGHESSINPALRCVRFMPPLYTLRIQVCPKEGITPKDGIDGPQSYSRDGSGFLGMKNQRKPVGDYWQHIWSLRRWWWWFVLRFAKIWCLEKVPSTYSPKMLVLVHGDESHDIRKQKITNKNKFK